MSATATGVTIVVAILVAIIWLKDPLRRLTIQIGERFRAGAEGSDAPRADVTKNTLRHRSVVRIHGWVRARVKDNDLDNSRIDIAGTDLPSDDAG